MNTTWGRLFGKTATFAVRLELIDDPDAGAGATEVETASWGGFELHVRGRNLCAHYDGGALSQAVNWYLWPLALWVRSRWTPLLHEEQIPVPAEDALRAISVAGSSDDDLQALTAWWQRHHLWAAADGGLFPELTIRRLLDTIEFAWDSGAALPGRPPDYRFVEGRGRAVVDVALVADVMAEAFSALTEEIARRIGPGEAYALRDAWRDLPQLDLRGEAVRWSVAAPVRDTRFISSIADALPIEEGAVLRRRPPLLALFASASPTLDQHDIEQLVSSVVASRPDENPRLKTLSTTSIPLTQSRWEAIRSLAASLAADNQEYAGPPFDIERFMHHLGVIVDNMVLHDPGIGAVTLADGKLAPIVAINTGYRNYSKMTRRFSIAHELGHLILDRSDARQLGITSGPWAPYELEQRAGAFAAALLIPAEPLKVAVAEEPTLDADRVRRLADFFQVPWTAMLGQLRFDGYLSWETHDALRHAAAAVVRTRRPTSRPSGQG